MRTFSDDLRLRIHEARQAGETTAEVAERFAVSPAFVRRLEQRFRLTGSPPPPPRPGRLARPPPRPRRPAGLPVRPRRGTAAGGPRAPRRHPRGAPRPPEVAGVAR